MTLSRSAFAIISQNLLAIPREMGAKLIQSAFSTIVREARDCSAALLDAKGRVIAQVDQNPILLGSMSATFRWSLDYLRHVPIGPDDFVITNDPYAGGQHLQDVFIFFPVFAGDRIVGYTATVAHHLDIGGAGAGISASAVDVYGEGLRLPPIVMNYTRDWNGGALERIIAANVRVPDLTIGDFNAQFAANAIGRARFAGLIEKYGFEVIDQVAAETLDYTEKMMRGAIARIPDGTYTGTDYIDDDGDGGGPVPVCVTVTVAGEEIEVDFEGTGPQVSGNMNSPYAASVSAVLCALKALLTPSHVPFNQGGERAVTIKAPLGCLLNPRPPAAVRARLEACYRAYNAIMLALAPVLPEKVAAPGFDTLTVASLTRLGEKGYSVYLEVFGGGNGATQGADGCSAVDSPLSNCTNTPVESADRGYDFFRVTAYEIVPDSCGHGTTRGGLGFRKRFEILKDGVVLAFYGDRFKLAARGIFGGTDATVGGFSIERDGEIIQLSPRQSHSLRTGDIVTVALGGGGGYGKTDDRDPARVLADIDAGFVSEAVARDVYHHQRG
ncbi:hydantoinase B/oxoprolinase family protein [Pseudoxanthobacter sp. M-2]|uniref:hydantoinase B/oxoprolinase family protein n=1 Tax=Pseudoxanthobacter sp. M-2 TaxID=3078754 RepID=UPI0038FC5740